MSKLRTARKRLGRTMADVAEVIGIDVSHMSRIERGMQVPSPEVARRIAVYYKGKVTEMDILFPKGRVHA